MITTKTELLQTFRDAHKNYKETPIKWIPETYLLNSPLDCSALIEVQETNDKSESPVQIIWIYKPSSSNRGRGLKVIEGIHNLKEIVILLYFIFKVFKVFKSPLVFIINYIYIGYG